MKTAALAVGLIALLIVAVLTAINTFSVGGTSNLPPIAWVMMVLGVLLSVGVGAGLMTLVFFSNRRGYDVRAQDHIAPHSDRALDLTNERRPKT